MVEPDYNTQTLYFEAKVPNNSWFSIGFGQTMSNTDMIAWRAASDQSDSLDLYSTGYGLPATDGENNVETTFTDDEAGTITFTSQRKFDTGDSQDYALEFDKNIVMCYAQS